MLDLFTNRLVIIGVAEPGFNVRRVLLLQFLDQISHPLGHTAWSNKQKARADLTPALATNQSIYTQLLVVVWRWELHRVKLRHDGVRGHHHTGYAGSIFQ